MTNKRARDDSSFPHEPGGTRPWAIRSKVQQSVGQQPAVENSNNTDPLLTNDQIILILDHPVHGTLMRQKISSYLRSCVSERVIQIHEGADLLLSYLAPSGK